ncbi:Multidrug resistance protein MdtC [Polaribacter huanghezhanensis]|uniref:efflux RND transporter permease subunit n=1 Tax=Polaribacter huanghezhanensis TaxID=1354726 RepID=UPI0026488D77|nr:efflux RND transporter permease subunit [Polaribacter huanghezhanensis]WKD85235.1 Multidrug resistance protein MdtC [Polaribacter huanghezhanensis]
MKFLIHKPIAVIMTALGILILGIFASTYVPVSLMPDIDIQEITVQVNAKNSTAYELEKSVIKPLRNNLLQLNHLENIKSETSNGQATIKLNFTHGTKIDYTFIEVNEKIDRAMSSLPRDIDRPKVIKASASDIPVFYLNVTLKNAQAANQSNNITPEFIEFNQFANQVIRKRIEQITEVALVDVNGLVYPEIVVIPNPSKCLSLGIDLNEIESVIKKQQIEIGSILVKDSQYQYNLRLGTTLTNLKDIENIYLNKNGKLYQLKDIAQVKEQPQKRKGLVLSNGKEAVSLAIIKQSDARIKDLKTALQTTIAAMEADYPEINFSITRDQTKLLDVAINNLSQSLLWGMLLAFVVMFFFLKDIKSPILIGISIPVSIIICLLFFHLLGISINIISLSGLVLGIGLMIDNSIIVIDNITQYREMGYSLSDACVKGTNEVFKPLLSSVLTTCAVFIPLIFLSGITGALFYDQAMAITIGLFVSLLISITLLPVIYRLFYLKEGRFTKINAFIKKINRLNYEKTYEKGFRFVMKKQGIAFIIFFSFIVLTVSLFFMLPKKTMPTLSNSETFLKVDWNESINVEENKKRVLKLIEPIKNSIDDYNAFVGQQQFLLSKEADAKTSEVTLYVKTSSPKKLVLLKKELSNYLNKNYPQAIQEFKEVDNIFNIIFSENDAPLTAKIRSVENIGTSQKKELKALWKSLRQKLPDIEVQPISWEENIILLANKEKMILYNVESDAVFNTLKSAFNEREIFSLVDNQNYIPVVLGGEEKTIREVLHETQIKVNDSTRFSIAEFITEVKEENLKTITAGKDGEYYAMNLEVINEKPVMKKIKEVIAQNKQFDVTFTGSIFKNKKLINELLVVLIVTLILLYFILASQFESLTLPFIILLEIPIAMAGAFLLLYLFDYSLNLMSMIGIVVMSGIVINDSILKIDTIIQLQKQRTGLLKALLVAGKRRLKPILMTSLTTILALLPVLLTNGIGAELQAPLAIALIGGMLLGTIVSLYLIPLCFYHLSKKNIYVVK